MPQTYHQLKSQIAELQAHAEGVKHAEVAGVIAKAKEAIQVYGLTRSDLFDDKAAGAPRGLEPAKKSKGKKAKSTEAKYVDGKGGSWVGRGKRPRWLNDLLKAGAKLEDLVVSKFTAASQATMDALAPAPAMALAPGAAPAPKKRASKKKAAAKNASARSTAKKTAKAKYQDGAGNSWGGMGPRPRWLKQAIASGKKLEDFLS